MKKIILVLLVLIFMAYPIKGQDKMNPDGYIGGLTLTFEAGQDKANGDYKSLIWPISGTPTMYLKTVQKVTISNPFLKLSVLFPATRYLTFFLNTYSSWYDQKYNKEDDYIYSHPNNLSFSQFSISGGFKLHLGRK